MFRPYQSSLDALIEHMFGIHRCGMEWLMVYVCVYIDGGCFCKETISCSFVGFLYYSRPYTCMYKKYIQGY